MLALLIESALRLLLLGGAVWLGLKLFRLRNPQVQMTVWSVVLLASLVMPLVMHCVTVPLPTTPPPVPLARLVGASADFAPAPLSPAPALEAPRPSTDAVLAPRPMLQPTATAPESEPISRAFDWRLAATAIYLAVAAVLLARLLVGLVLTWRLARSARPIAEAWAAGLDVRVSGAVGVPVTFGSTILLPPECAQWDGAKLRAVLSHEGSHVAHGDFYLLLLAALNRAVFWFSPFAWWQFTRLAELAEAISDDAAIAALEDRPSYAGILLDVARKAQHAPPALAMARPQTVRRRVERILAATTVPARVGWRARALIALALLPVVALSAATFAPRTSTASAQSAALAVNSPPQAAGFAAPQTNVASERDALDGYVGHYQLYRRSVFTVTRAENQLFAQLTGQPKLPLQPAGNGEYAYGSAADRISFITDDNGTATRLVLHQNGQDWPSARVDEARAVAIEGRFARLIAEAPERFRGQSPAQGGRDAVLRTIAGLQSGAPDYEGMSLPLADNMRRQLAQLHAMLTALGPVESVFFRGVGPGGYDIYGAKFANGIAEFRLMMGADGSIDDVLFRPDGDDTPGGVAACSDAPSLKAERDTAPIKLVLFNGSGADIQLLSVDFEGHRTRHAIIGDEMTGTMLTYVARPWIVADAAGQCLEVVWPGQRTRFLMVSAGGHQSNHAAAARRTPAAGSEEALRRYIDMLRSGEPDYRRMTTEVAGETRRQLLLNQAILTKLGPLRAMLFRGVTPLDNDLYIVHFANGSAEWRIGLVKDGRIGRIALGPRY
jgi:beta-lactamase regulating signal transducer with metallopeptidase domain